MVSVNKPPPPIRQCFLGLDVDDLNLFHVALARVAPRAAHEIDYLNVRHRSAVAKDREPLRPLKPDLKPLPFVRNEFTLVVILVRHRIE